MLMPIAIALIDIAAFQLGFGWRGIRMLGLYFNSDGWRIIGGWVGLVAGLVLVLLA